MAHDQHAHQETDTKAAFMGLIIGVIVLFLVVRGIVWATNAHYAGKTPHAATK